MYFFYFFTKINKTIIYFKLKFIFYKKKMMDGLKKQKIELAKELVE